MNNDKILVSVIMSCYNEKIEWIKQSVDSILHQTYENIELIIVCDNPEYNDLKMLLNQYEYSNKKIRVIYNKKNIGLTASLNLALKLCKGEFIARMDADDVSDKSRIRKQIDYIHKMKADFVMSGAYFMDENGKIHSKSSSYSCNENNIIKLLRYGNTSIHPTWLFKKEILNKIVEYTDIEYAEDYDFLCRIVLHGYKIVCMHEPLIAYRRRNSGITKSKRIQQEISAQIIGKCYYNHLTKKSNYDPMYYKQQIKTSDIELDTVYYNNFKKGKEYLKQKKIIKGSYLIINTLMKSRLKRNQLINYIKLRKMYKEDRDIKGKAI